MTNLSNYRFPGIIDIAIAKKRLKDNLSNLLAL